ncbi:MAG TPA: metalloregulator ArsR/SmtB family transcription factor [Polyangiaceae bacterium]|jgi:ArsR family transcriptional regulator|nr:metalloregulator ArsR/SmtB family transcription factor [Polyangiaceae bacterium]
MTQVATLDARWQLYRLLADPFRLRLLALAAEEELALGELADLLGESQPNLSRHAAPLRQAGLLSERRQGTRTLVRLDAEAKTDPVVSDALLAGRALCERDGSLTRIATIVHARDQKTREFFARPSRIDEPLLLAPELPVYIAALASLLDRHALAVDAGTGDGALLDVLAPAFDRVIALDRSTAQLARAERRVLARGYDNVTLHAGEIGDAELRRAVGDGADVVVAARVLHHAPLPRETFAALAALLRPGGSLLLLDYARHADEALREAQADVWMGFDARELEDFARGAGLEKASARELPRGLFQNDIDGHLSWLLLSAKRATSKSSSAR